MYRPLVITEEDGEEVDPHLVVHVPPVQQQNGASDCGVFAIAFAVHKLLGDNLKEIEFDQDQMRNHLLGCLKKRKFSYTIPYQTTLWISTQALPTQRDRTLLYLPYARDVWRHSNHQPILVRFLFGTAIPTSLNNFFVIVFTLVIYTCVQNTIYCITIPAIVNKFYKKMQCL